jgi:DNA damage-binding protein 1
MIFAKFRAFKNTVREEEEPMRFVDGELVERFLDVSEDIQREAIAGLGVELEEVKGMIEGLRRLH